MEKFKRCICKKIAGTDKKKWKWCPFHEQMAPHGVHGVLEAPFTIQEVSLFVFNKLFIFSVINIKLWDHLKLPYYRKKILTYFLEEYVHINFAFLERSKAELQTDTDQGY